MKALLIIACLSLLVACDNGYTPVESEAIYKGEKACIDAGMTAYLDNSGFVTHPTVVCKPYEHPKP